MTKERIRVLMKEKLGVDPGERHEDIVKVARDFLRQKFLTADGRELRGKRGSS